MRKTRILHIAQDQPDPRIWSAVFVQALKEFGEIELVAGGQSIPDAERARMIRDCEILLTCWGAQRCPEELASDPGQLKYICNITGELARFLPVEFIDAGIRVSNWGDYPAIGVAEGAMSLLLATLKDTHYQIQNVRNDGWKMDMHYRGGSLYDAEVAIYGLGVIGQRFLELIRPFGAKLRLYDPYLGQTPDGCVRCHSLEEMMEGAQILVIHAALTDETRGSITADLLAKLPRQGVVINTARGGIIDQTALFHELESGRLRAGLDVLEPDHLAEDHPARRWENLILTAHRVDHGWPDFNEPPTRLNRMQEICIDNLGRHLSGEKPRFLHDRARYLRST